jgi:hypothetical protein
MTAFYLAWADSRRCCIQAMHLLCFVTKQPSLEFKKLAQTTFKFTYIW